MIRIIADKGIPFLKGVFEPYAEVIYKDGKDVTPADASTAQAMIIRTRTKCNEALLGGSSVRIIATATIGTDHIDLGWCSDNGIVVRNAPGCNAGGVMQYVFTAIYSVAERKQMDLAGKTIGIVGVGHVGSKVEALARYLGFNVLLCDPPRAAAEGPDGFVDLDYLLSEADIVTMHVPLDGTTRKMADASFFDKMKAGAMFINASRGEVVDDQAIKTAFPKLGAVVIDTWNHEPEIDREVLSKVDIATPHIAGYSYQGKQNGTAAAVRAVADFFGIEELHDFYPLPDKEGKNLVAVDLKGKNQSEIAAELQEIYPIFEDDSRLRNDPSTFERQRTEYDYRNEFRTE